MYKILVVEDNLINQKVVVKFLEKTKKYEVSVANNGQEALDRLARESFDLILMDLQMPVMGGYEATEQIRDKQSQGLLPYIPIIALTAHALQCDREACLAIGMNDYLTKPIDPHLLYTTLEKTLAAN